MEMPKRVYCYRCMEWEVAYPGRLCRVCTANKLALQKKAKSSGVNGMSLERLIYTQSSGWVDDDSAYGVELPFDPVDLDYLQNPE